MTQISKSLVQPLQITPQAESSSSIGSLLKSSLASSPDDSSNLPSPAEPPVDLPGIAALVLGICSLYFHSKQCAILTVIFALSSYVTVRKRDFEWRQFLTMWMFAVVGLGVNYFVNWDGKY
mmetsp:Transcript_11433/g.42945  ORF Transcript_11433/g.42945 Transcript_11433/m.42945 type:complete len:121 (-) Transcript_11433:507-869(-)